MAKTGNQKLAEALRQVSTVSSGNIANSADIAPKVRTLLVQSGYLKQIVRGWYLFDADMSAEKAGESALWFESIWHFIGCYMNDSYGDDYWLSPEASLDLHTANNAIPKQLVVFTQNGKQRNVSLPNDMSLMVLPTKTLSSKIVEYSSVRVLSLEYALASLAPSVYRLNPLPVQIAIGQSDVNEVAAALIESTNLNSAKRLVGAYKECGRKADSRKLKTMIEAAGFDTIQSENPFDAPLIDIGNHSQQAPAAIRVRMLWAKLRDSVESTFNEVKFGDFFETPLNQIVESMDKLYVSDAYHSLSIEGYVVSEDLIEKVAKGEWNAETIEADKKHKDALAARGYYEAFEKLKGLIEEAHQDGKDNFDLAYLLDVGITEVYTALFSPCVTAGIINPQDLAGYRKGPIMIRTSMHVPPPSESLMDCMDALNQLIVEEPSYAVKAVLGHFFLGYIHPFPDGNGRTCRFLMNFCFLLGGYRWTVVPVTERVNYLAALESASINGNSLSFAKFLCDLMPDEND
ncbi:Fic family protein [Vibrio sp. 99-8-1]|uniref:Fic family protein n=1 Tax=Vibrio sp. 99-8-1 TaxID=2607602 RepID=UPI001493648C|nr:Fic family protein [Vibrio sp. 99-8-1]NOI65185.1 hypothetical protein [Vibrio sp. 99-8-1]